MYEHVVVEHIHLRAQHSTPQHSTAQHSANSPAQSSTPSTCRSERGNASKHTELARASVVDHIYTARCVLKTNQEINFCLAYSYKRIKPTTHKAAFSWCGRRECLYFQNPSKILQLQQYILYQQHCCFLLLSVLSAICIMFRTGMRRPRWFPLAWSAWHFASRQFAPKNR